MKPLVSILIPVYNAQEWLLDALRSALAQTWDRKEVIVVDDGSTDDTPAIARQFESRHVKVVTQPNQGCPGARNTAVSLSQGDYLQYLDGDDVLAPDKIARQMAIVGRSATSKTLISGSWGRFFYRYYRTRFVPTSLWCDLSPIEWLLHRFEEGAFMFPGAWLVSRQLTQAAGPWNAGLLVDDDGEYFCRVVCASDGVRFVPEAKGYYRKSGSGSVSYIKKHADSKRESLWISTQLQISHIRSKEESERVRAACVRFLQTRLLYFYPERLDIVHEAEETARQLGGHLVAPPLSWKLPVIGPTEIPYCWIKAMFGWDLAKSARLSLPTVIWAAVRQWDKTLFRMQYKRRDLFWNQAPGMKKWSGPSEKECKHRNARATADAR